MTATLTKAEMFTALQLYGQHHPDCAAVWPEKPCDCGLAALGVDKPVPPLDSKKAGEDDEALKDWSSTNYDERMAGRPGMADRPGFRNGVGNRQPRERKVARKPGQYQVAATVGKTDTTVTKICTGCSNQFTQPRRHGRQFSKCEACR